LVAEKLNHKHSDMTPLRSPHYVSYLSAIHSEDSSNALLSIKSSCVKSPDFKNLNGLQFRRNVEFSNCPRNRSILSALGNLIAHILLKRSRPEMIGANAIPNVTLVTNLFTFGNRPIMKKPAQDMSADRIMWPVGNHPVKPTGAASSPQPATTVIRNDHDFTPKAFNDGGGKPLLSEVLWSYVNHGRSLLGTPCSLGYRAFSFYQIISDPATWLWWLLDGSGVTGSFLWPAS